jgi:hypothetical protein
LLTCLKPRLTPRCEHDHAGSNSRTAVQSKPRRALFFFSLPYIFRSLLGLLDEPIVVEPAVRVYQR